MINYFYLYLVTLLSAGLYSCSSKISNQLNSTEITQTKKAEVLAHAFLITDGHVDLPYRLRVTNFPINKRIFGHPGFNQ